MVLFDVGLFIAALLVVSKASDIVVNKAVDIAHALRMRTMAVGVVFISLMTTTPEMFVSLFSVVQNQPGLGLGNVFGSVFTNLTIILALIVFIGGKIYMTNENIFSFLELLLIMFVVPLLLFQLGSLGLLHGIILFTFFIIFVNRMRTANHDTHLHNGYSFAQKMEIFVHFFGGMVLLLGASYFLVDSSLNIARFYSINSELIGLTIVAIGTSIPELSIGIRSVKKGEYGLALGDLFGSCISDITIVLGLILVASPIPVDVSPLIRTMPLIFLSIVIPWFFLMTKKYIGYRAAGSLAFFYVLFLLYEFGIYLL